MNRAISKKRAAQAVLSRGWLATQCPEFQDLFLSHAQTQAHEAGEYTHHIGDESGGMFGIVKGSFGVLGQNLAMNIAMGHIYRRGAWFGEGPILLNKPRMLSYRAMEPSLLLHVPFPALERMLQQHPDAKYRLMTLIAWNAHIATRVVSDLLIRRSDRRIGAVLLRVTCMDEADTLETGPFHVTQSDLAEMANCSRQTVNTVLKRFESLGWIKISYGTLLVLDARSLRRFLSSD